MKPKHYPRNKGVKSLNEIINYFLTIDRLRGFTYGELAKIYRLDKSNIQKRIRTYFNSLHGEIR